MTKLVINRGLPASGKTTYSRLWLEEEPANRARVNRDDIRALLFAKPTYAHAQEQLVTAVERDIARTFLRAGWDVIVDDTNLRPKYVREWMRFARTNGVTLLVINEHHVDVETAVVRDAARENPVGEDVIRNMARKYMRGGGVDPLSFLPIPDEVTDDSTPDQYTPDDTLPHAIIVDIDGTVALKHPDRNIYDLSKVADDIPNWPVIAAVQAAKRDGAQIVYCSGREDSARADTAQWIAEHVEVPGELWMRAAGDKRKDSVVKRELFDAHIRDRYAVQYVIDDRQQVVDMWRGLGLTVLQCAAGDF